MWLNLTLFERLLHRLHLLPTPIMDAFGGIIYGRVLTSAVRQGLFEAVADESRSVQQIADATGLHPRAVALVAEAFAAGGYLKRKGSSYCISDDGSKWFLRRSPHYLGNLVRYFETLYTRWERFEHCLEHGVPARSYLDLLSQEDWRIYVYGMRDLAKLLLPHVESKLVVPGSPRALLDLGGSHGLYALSFCRRYPTLHATVVDFAPALEHTRELATSARVAERITTVAGDFRELAFPPNLDAVLMSNVVHGLQADKNQALIGRAHAALNSADNLFILDQMKDARRCSHLGTLVPLMVGLNMLNEVGGTVYDVREVERWCSAFGVVRRHRLRLAGVVPVEAVKG